MMKLKLIEPLRELFKDGSSWHLLTRKLADNENKEVRELGTKLGVPEHLIFRHPFPGPGLGIRVLGEVTPSQLRIAREADKIFIDEIMRGTSGKTCNSGCCTEQDLLTPKFD